MSPRPAPDRSTSRLRGPERPAAEGAPRPRDRVWLLDLDNTLHDSRVHLLPRIDRAMTRYMMDHLALDEAAAGSLRRQYWTRFGATLLGLVRQHQVDPADFLRRTHQFPDMRALVRRDGRLRRALVRLPGRKILVTNAPHHYARQVIGSLGVAPLIEAIISIEAMSVAGRLRPKPSRALMHRLVARLRTHSSRCVMVEDTPANLRSARAARLSTVLVTGFTDRAPRASGATTMAGRARIVDLQVQSVDALARSRLRTFFP